MKNPPLQRYLIKAAWLWLFHLFCHFQSTAQTNISGIVNSYYNVIEVIPAKACVRVGSTSGLAGAYKVLIIQMKGATITTTNNNTFGNISSLNDAGNYEVGYICFIRDDSVFLTHTLLNSYTPSDGKVQLIPFAEYDAAIVTDTIKPRPWNNATGTGGVIAISVMNSLTLAAPVYADSGGFRGGAFYQHAGDCNFFSPVGTGYVYDATSSGSQNGAYKGEGIANVTADMDGGKGSPANGGGGGNNHNNSGGGGANLNNGGNGGGNSSSGPSGCNTAGNEGLAGKALSNMTGTRIYAGGGGGAGHTNGNAFTSGGGNGGGIIFIYANTLVSNGHKISANGGAGSNSLSDGASGGGAGGTIIMDVANFTDAVNIQANGGSGGNSDNDFMSSRCFAGGGGGSGGVIYFTSATPAGTAVSNGGAEGIETRRGSGCGTPVPALPGQAGQVVPAYTYRRSSVFSANCGIVLPVRLINFNALLILKKVTLSWRVVDASTENDFIVERKNRNGDWQEIATIVAVENQESYSTIDANPMPGDNYYRVLVREKNAAFHYSPIRHVVVESEAAFRVAPNPASDKITVSGAFPLPTECKLVDMTGKVVFKSVITTTPASIRLPALSQGIYFLRINETTKKLVIR